MSFILWILYIYFSNVNICVYFLPEVLKFKWLTPQLSFTNWTNENIILIQDFSVSFSRHKMARGARFLYLSFQALNSSQNFSGSILCMYLLPFAASFLLDFLPSFVLYLPCIFLSFFCS